jgi:D-amino-acid dehydrogenase
MMPAPVTVLGAGVVGLCCALALQRSGCRVTLIDRASPGMGCSFGNAGMIQTGSVLSLAGPGILSSVPRMLLDPQAALVLRWMQVPRLMPWFAALLRNSRPEKVATNARLLATLLFEAKRAYRELADDPAAQSIFRSRGELYVFPDARAYDAAACKFSVYRDHGIEYSVLLGDDLRAFEPALSPTYRHGYYRPDSEYVVDPLRLSNRLLELFTSAGGGFVQAPITALSLRPKGAVELLSPAGNRICERLVLAAGALSGRLARPLGIVAPIEPLRGYHVVVPHPDVRLSGPVVDGVMNVAATPMEDGVRLAGTLEFAGFNSAPRWRRATMLAPMAQRMIPGLPLETRTRWFGDRPGTPDGLPVIGRASSASNVWCAFGHGMLGLTLAAITGKLIAQSITGVSPSIDLTGFRPDRFKPSAGV